MRVGAFDTLRFPKRWDRPWQCYGLAIGAFAISLGLRFALRPVFPPPNAGYIIFLPAMVATTLFGGYRAGILSVILSLFAVWYFFLSPYQTIGLALVRAADYVVVVAIVLAFIQWVREVIGQLEEERKNLEAAALREKELIKELQHRRNNLFAIIHGLAARTFDAVPPEARRTFLGRLEALSRADHRLVDSDSRGTTLHYLIRAELDPFTGRFSTDGDDIFLDSSTARNFSLVLHELATNASKYGALSTGAGRVGMTWVKDPGRRLKFTWIESGGPEVMPPKRVGLGTALVKTALGPARLEYLAGGFRYEAEVRLDS
jgi:two-component sensor histidine kinase